jgi:hypothetical protein
LPSWQIKAQAELELRKRRGDYKSSADFSRYASDPVGFGHTVLGDTFTPDIERVMLSVRDNPVTVARSAVDVGKTHVAARVAVWFYSVFDDAQVWTTATPENNLKLLLWGEIGSLIEKHAALFANDRIRVMHIERGPQSFITGVAISASGTREQRIAKFSGKHAPHLLFIMDEGDTIPDEIYEAVEGCMSGGHARMLVMFNPKAELGPVYQMERDGRANVVQLSALNHPNVLTGNDVIPGCVSRDTTVRRINEWSRPLAEGEPQDNECFELPAYLVGIVSQALSGITYEPLTAGWRKITDPALSYMVLGQYPAQAENQLISRAWIDAAVMRWRVYVAQHGEAPSADIAPLAGLDVADMGTDSNALCLRYGGFVARLKAWRGVDPDMTAIKAADMCKVLNPRIVNVDATGVGAGVAPRMTRLGVMANGIYVAESPTYTVEQGEFGTLRDQLWWSVREWLRTDPGAMIPPDDRLVNSLAAPQYAKNDKGKIKVTNRDTLVEQLGYSPDEASALCLTFAPQAGILARKIKI